MILLDFSSLRVGSVELSGQARWRVIFVVDHPCRPKKTANFASRKGKTLQPRERDVKSIKVVGTWKI